MYRTPFFQIALLCLVLCSTLAGCVPPPAPEEIARGDYGSWPHTYQDVIKRHMQYVFTDPTSAQYEFIKGPTRTWSNYTGGLHFGYAVCAMITTKNSHGRETGAQEYYFLINQDAVVEKFGGANGVEHTVAKTACQGIPMRYTS